MPTILSRWPFRAFALATLTFTFSVGAFAQTWIQLTPTGGPPPARIAHTAVLDSLDNMIVFGGYPEGAFGAPPLFNDVWVLSNADGSGQASAWTQLMPQGPTPAARGVHTAVYDPSTNSMIVFGGNLSVGNCFDEANDLWVLANANGVGGTPTWSQITPAGGPPSIRDGHSAVYDSANNRMIVFGGRVECSNPNAEIWVLANANGVGGTPTWTQLSPTAGSAPVARAFHSAVYDPGSNSMIIFGGANSTNSFLNDVWVLANANGLGGTPTWTELTPNKTLPPARQGQTAIYNPATNAMTIFAGSTSIGIANDVWTLADANGLRGTPTWMQVQPTGGPPVPRSFHSAVSNLSTERMTVFGGANSASIGLNDTWVLGPTPTTTTLTVSANPSDAGDLITFTAGATSSSGIANGTIALSDGGTVLAVLPAPFPASYTTSALAAGTHNITAQFTPSDPTTFAPSSASLVETIISLSQLPLLSGNNSFTGNQLVNGTVTASSFAGNGSGLTNVTASGVACAGCIGNTQLGISYAAGDAQGGNALNALLFGGLAPSAFAPANGSGNYVAKSGDTMTGALNVPSLLSSGNVSGTSGNFTGNASQDIFDVVQNGSGSAFGGFSLGPTGPAVGVLGLVASPAGQGVRGVAAATSGGGGIGVDGVSAGNGSAGPAGVGVQGEATSPTGFTFAVRGVNFGTGGTGVFGVATTSTGSTTGVMGQVSSPNGIAGRFVNTAGGLLLSGENGSSTLFRVDGGGNVTATSYAGNGAGLTNIQATTLSPGTIISGSQVSGPVANAITAVNLTGNINDTQVNNLGADLASATTSAITASEGYANNTFLPLAGGTMTGTLNLPAIFVQPGPGVQAGAGIQLDSNGISSLRGLQVLNIAPRNGGTPAFTYGSQDIGNVFQMFVDSSTPNGTQDTFRIGTIRSVPLHLVTNGLSNTRMFIGVDGSVGIGTTTPAHTLDVVGDINSSSNITTGGIFTGNGAGLTNVAATSATSATSLNCTGCIGNTQLGVNYAGSASQGGPATTALSALQSNNALALGGVPSSGYAPASGSTVYVAKAGDTMTGNLSVPTLDASGTVSASGSLIVGGGTPILQHISILVNPAFAALKPGACTTADFTLTGAADGDTIALGVPNARMTGGGSLIYTAWVSAADTITVQACNANANSPQKTAGTGSIRVDLWKH